MTAKISPLNFCYYLACNFSLPKDPAGLIFLSSVPIVARSANGVEDIRWFPGRIDRALEEVDNLVSPSELLETMPLAVFINSSCSERVTESE